MPFPCHLFPKTWSGLSPSQWTGSIVDQDEGHVVSASPHEVCGETLGSAPELQRPSAPQPGTPHGVPSPPKIRHRFSNIGVLILTIFRKIFSKQSMAFSLVTTIYVFVGPQISQGFLDSPHAETAPNVGQDVVPLCIVQSTAVQKKVPH